MKFKSLIAIATLALCAQGVMAQPKARLKAQAEAEKKSETSLSERAKAQYTAQMPSPTDVVWKRDIYRTLDMTKEKNAALYYPVEPLGDRVNLFTLVIRLVADGKVPAYEYRSDGNELFTEENKYKVTDMLDKFYIYYEEKDGRYVIADSDIPSGEVLSYFIKESSFYDQRTATYTTRVTAICPVLHRSGDFGSETTKYPMFWLNYDEVSPYLGMTPLMTSSYNNVSNMSIDDYFVRSLYEGDIYKTANLQNKLLAQYCPNDTAMKAEQQRIEKELVTFENKLWGIEEPDTTTAAPAKAEKKASASRSAARPAVSRAAKAAPARQETKAEKKPAEKSNASVRTARTKAAPASKSAASSQTLSVRRQRR
ncbi:MAG: gliding motility protein GldN [Bacteroidaceae bacterium]|nr:gliding motility protein GldN [Bacteroidaceae bacterium]